ncbi:aminofutalosine deaminase family hydrolase [Helicobacter salomonis]|uniref:aminofutalosine deaminase family hydrolase n=1 Tax=Helicobacter salomonis TaxID=56878 RepID=UPI000CF1B184|nr:aminofutalosine deaminase family hydrolase [Helicobacter salomonis]
MKDALKIIGASTLIPCDASCGVLEEGGVAISKGQIVEVGKLADLKHHYPSASLDFYKHGLLMPALINPHIHFEFSAHRDTFVYGKGFEGWLASVVQKRESIFANAQRHIQRAIHTQLQNGVGSVGAISSYGLEREILAHSDLRVVFFDELIGSAPHALEQNFKDFQHRHTLSLQYKSPTFTPAIAIHSPYSVHKELARRVLEMADTHTPISTHFLESLAELEWLEHKQGWFGHFFQEFLGVANPVPGFEGVEDFLNLFAKKHLLLVHALFAQPKHLEYAKTISAQTHIITCPRSNRLLSGQLLDPARVQECNLPYALATDGNSSNLDVNLLEELRHALFALPGDLERNAQDLLLACTARASEALGLNSGCLQVGKDADLAIFSCKRAHTPLDILLKLTQAKKVRALYIQGKRVLPPAP